MSKHLTQFLASVKSSKAPNGATPQNQPIPGSNQISNSAGGFSFPVDDWTRLRRFLILGSEGGSYYAGERKLTAENAGAVLRCIDLDGARTVNEICAISVAGRAPKNDPALFALALCAGVGNDATRALALAALPKVARTGTHLFHFVAFVSEMRGWGRGLRRAIADWYGALGAEKLGYQALKYGARDGWSHRDLLRLAHPKAQNEAQKIIYHWIAQGWPGVGEAPHDLPALRPIWASERAKALGNASKSALEGAKTDIEHNWKTPQVVAARALETAAIGEVVGLIREYRLPREAIPTHFLNSPAIWEALLEEMPMTAMIRNLATMTKIGLLAPNSNAARHIVAQLSDVNRLRAARVHPIALLSALRTYAGGQGVRSSATWKPVSKVVDALDEAFYLAFGSLVPSGKRHLLALDVSGSMGWGQIAGVAGLTPREASAAMALVTANSEREVEFMAFSHTLVKADLSARMRLDAALKVVDKIPMGGTDCALPMLWAAKNKVETDVFVIYTDSETWFGNIHPTQALAKYREQMGIAAKLIVVGMLSNGFTIADSNDAGMLDVVGFDTATPSLMSEFASS